MALSPELKKQLSGYLDLMENDISIKLSISDDKVSSEMKDLVDELNEMSSKIHVDEKELDRTPSFSVDPIDGTSGITFAGNPLGHEFTSLVLALLQVSGRAPKVDEEMIKRIQSIDETLHFETYISLSCNNCPDVVQALNIMSVLNPKISHTMIEGNAFKQEVEDKKIMAVPSVYLNGESLTSGRMTLAEVVSMVSKEEDTKKYETMDDFDVLVVGGGPAGSSASIYAARKGLRTGVVAERFGGQVLETVGIENFISVKKTEGSKLAANLLDHMKDYDIELMDHVIATGINKKEKIELELSNGATLKTKSLILATGAKWRQLGVPGEEEFKNKGVAYCPHCDGPLFENKRVAVVGGGNSGIEAAIDLAGIVEHVTVLEFLPELKADEVLQDRLYSLDNVTVLKNVATKEIVGSELVEGLIYIDRETNEETTLALEGVFVQIGLVPNTEWLGDTIERNRMGEIVVDKKGSTTMEGVFAAGDCTDSAYKQIIISMGSGATASLSAFDYIIRN